MLGSLFIWSYKKIKNWLFFIYSNIEYTPKQGGMIDMKKKITTKDIVLTGLGMAIVFIATLFIKIPNALDGYFNLGDGFILLFASILNPFYAFLVGGLGSALADIAGGYAYYFFPTLVIKGLEGIVVSYLMSRYGKKVQISAYLIGAVIMVVGYFLAKWYLKSSVEMALAGIPENIFQSGVGAVIAFICYPIVKKVKDK